MKRLKSTIVFLLLILFVSCDKDDSPSTPQNQDPNPTAFAQNFGNEISRDFLGTVIDKNRNPIENVTIIIGSDIAMTDANGVFIIRDATVNERFGYVKAEKAGYILGSRSVVPSSGTNKVTIMLLEETIVGTTNSGTSETITLPNGASVALEGEYIKEDGTSYSGSVNIILHHLDATDEDLDDKMPGMLYAANAQNEERMLQTFGMLAVELRGSNGEDLNLAENSEAEIKIPLDASLVANAPTTIPLWYFDEANGYWIEDGEATLVGNTYVGTVSHFTHWSCNLNFPTINLCINITDENNNPLSNLRIETVYSGGFGISSGNRITNEEGQTCHSNVPLNDTFEINVYTLSDCGDILIYNSLVGPFLSDSSISIQVENQPTFTISETVIGIFNNCDGNPITDGYVILTYAEQQFYDYIVDDNFELSLIRCTDDDTFSIEAYDYDTAQTTGEINYTFTTPSTNLGTLSSCNTIEEFIIYQIDSENEVIIFSSFYGSLYFSPNTPDIPRLSIGGYNNNDDLNFQFRLNDNPPYTGSYSYTFGNEIGFSSESNIGLFYSTNNNVISNINSFGEVNEYIDINFSGDYEDFEGNPHSITGVIHVLRDQ